MENDNDDDEVPRFGGKINEKFLDWETDVRRGGRDETSPWSTSPQEKDSLDSRSRSSRRSLRREASHSSGHGHGSAAANIGDTGKRL